MWLSGGAFSRDLAPDKIVSCLRYIVRAAYVDSPLSTTKWVIDELMRAYVRVLTGLRTQTL